MKFGRPTKIALKKGIKLLLSNLDLNVWCHRQSILYFQSKINVNKNNLKF